MPTLRVHDKKGNVLTAPIDPSGPRRTLLNELHRMGQEMIGQCGGHGICGQCQVMINSGATHDAQEPMAPPKEGRKMACCVTPDPSGGDLDVTLERAAIIPTTPKP